MITWQARLKGVAVGIAILAVGCLRIAQGSQVVTHWTGQPMFSFGLIAAGLVFIAASAIPARFIYRMTAIKKR